MSLFVQDEETDPVKKEHEDDILMEADSSSDVEEEDDPVVREVPIHINPLTDEKTKLMLLQYTTNRAGKSAPSVPRGIRFKERSKVVEVNLPFENQKFLNEEKAESWDDVKGQKLRGVVSQSENSGYYIGHVGADGDLHLTPLRGGTAQMRPSFTYIDDVRLKREKEENGVVVGSTDHQQQARTQTQGQQVRGQSQAPGQKGMHVVQMTAKSSNQTVPRLGPALRSRKMEEEEASEEYELKGRGNYNGEEMKQWLEGNEPDATLTAKGTTAEYIDLLMERAGCSA